MADDSEDLVSQIKVEGGAAAAAEVEAFAKKSGDALDGLAAKTEQSTGKQRDAFGRYVKGAQDATAATSAFSRSTGGVGPDLTRFAGGLKNLENGLAGFIGSLKQTTQAIGRFTGRIALVGTAAAGAAVGLVEGARKIAVAQGQTTSAFEKNTKAQQDQNSRMAEGQVTQIQLASSQRGLFRQLQKGEITYKEYNKAMIASNEQAKEQARVAYEVEKAQDRAKEANERLQKSLENRQALEKLINTFGGPLLTSITAFGNQAEATRQKFVQGFGPAIAAGIDVIGTVLAKNSGAIQKFIDDASSKIFQVIAQNGPAIEQALESVGSAFRAVFEGLIAAAPSILSFFNNGLVPAITAVRDGLTSIANAINFVFGTQITAGTIVFIALLLQLTGALRFAFAALKTLSFAFQFAFGAATIFFRYFGIWGIVILALAAALIYLATKVDWTKFIANAKAAVESVIQFFENLVNKITEQFTSFLPNLGLIFSTLWNLITAGAQAAVDGITAAWNGLIAWFAAFPGNVVLIFTTLWELIKTGAAAGVQFITDKWNEFVAFIQTLPAMLGQVWTDISTALSTAFNTAIETVKTYFSNLAATARSYLQPILDLINAILGSGTLGGGGNTPTVNAASGGHIRGAGTSTSDSIAAWLSNNEFVMRAKAVRQYGVGFMNAINAGKFRMPRFNMGGLNMIAPMPGRTHFADGGPVTTNMTPLNLSILGETFEGLMMPEDVAGRMTKFAIARSTRSAGRKPSWVGGKR